MSVWGEHEVENKITDILRETPHQEAHHFGRPYLSAYQLAIAVDRRWPEVRAALGNPPVGGLGIGTRNSLAQYLARELSRRIRSGDLTTVEGAFLTDEDLVELVYVESDGRRVTLQPHWRWLRPLALPPPARILDATHPSAADRVERRRPSRTFAVVRRVGAR